MMQPFPAAPSAPENVAVIRPVEEKPDRSPCAPRPRHTDYVVYFRYEDCGHTQSLRKPDGQPDAERW